MTNYITLDDCSFESMFLTVHRYSQIFLVGRSVHKLQNERTSSYNASASRQKVTTHLEHRAFAVPCDLEREGRSFGGEKKSDK